MSSIAEDFFKLVVCVILGWFPFWTGEAIVTILSVGFHKPRWGGYSGNGSLRWVMSDLSIGALGVIFWLGSFPFMYDFLNGAL